MTSSKKFRLFISSTFNDFRRERHILQTKVFPQIKDYASKVGYVFQPIDLRWGVSNEAQLDQKTLELCLDEVRACKTTMHPNFLIMLGDRYGWVPLPYAIEKDEFSKILNHLQSVDKYNFLKILHPVANMKLLNKWYKLDYNQLKPSYILQERTDTFKDYSTWEKEENKLREILQSVAVIRISGLTQEQKRKYFLSATESEVEEGIIPYIKPTAFQKKLLDNEKLLDDDSSLLTVDAQHVFGFFRDIKKDTKEENKFIEDDYEEAQYFKIRVKKELTEKNTLNIQTTQVGEEILDEAYLEEFEKRMIEFLESQVDTQKKKEKNLNLSDLEIELQAQEYFAKNKRKNFLGQGSLLKIIADYINNDTNQPLVIYGKSGRGKSALMSQAIEKIKKSRPKEVFYRFIGATPYSSSSKEVLTSIFDELGIDVKSEKDKEPKNEDKLSLTGNENTESFEDFSYRIYSELQNLKENVVIFIDAVDQLGNDDQFLWLPEQLPSNVKIILSALEDKNYKEDTKYFQTLKNKTNNLHMIPEFNEPKQLLKSLLSEENRTVQESQETYFLKKFKKSPSPLYVSIAAQEMKNWKVTDNSQDLAQGQREIIEEFIGNLSSVYHHNEKFVQKVLGYICASRDGLSESELLQLLSTDEEFVELMAPETWHENPNKELPFVHWSRLQTELKPFLSLKTQDGEELMYFFHREFEDVLKPKKDEKVIIDSILEHEAIIKATQKLILQNQDKDFSTNRWGKLYITLISKDNNRKEKEKEISFISNFSTINETWVNDFLNSMSSYGAVLHKKNNFQALYYSKITLNITKQLYKINKNRWTNDYLSSLKDTASAYKKQHEFIIAIELEEEALGIYRENGIDFISTFKKGYLRLLNNLAYSYKNNDLLSKAIEIEKFKVKKITELYQIDQAQWVDEYTRSLSNLANSYSLDENYHKAIELERESLPLKRELYNAYKDLDYYSDMYFKSLNNLALYLFEIDKNKEAISLAEEAYTISKEKYDEKPEIWVDNYNEILSTLSYIIKQNNPMKASEFQEEESRILNIAYQNNPKQWVYKYFQLLGDLTQYYYTLKDINNTIATSDTMLNILIVAYQDNPNKWIEDYVTSLDSIGEMYSDLQLFDKAIIVQKMILEPLKKLHIYNPTNWTENYVKGLNNTIFSYMELSELDKAIIVENHLINILKELYVKQPKEWIDAYMRELNNLADLYIQNAIKSKSLKTLHLNYTLASEYYGKDSNYTSSILKKINSIQNMNISQANLNTLLNIAKFFAISENETMVTNGYFIFALNFIRLDLKSRKIFSKLLKLDQLKQYRGSEEIIRKSSSLVDLPYSKELEELVKYVENIFLDKPIGLLR